MIAAFAGTFDPVTLGHLNLIERSAHHVEKLYIVLVQNVSKKPLFTVDERLEMLKSETYKWPNVIVESYSGLLVDYLKERNIYVIIKGVRSSADYEYELRMSLVNKALENRIETLFLPTEPQLMHVSSSVAKEIARYGGELDGIVSSCIEKKLIKKIFEQS